MWEKAFSFLITHTENIQMNKLGAVAHTGNFSSWGYWNERKANIRLAGGYSFSKQDPLNKLTAMILLLRFNK